MSTKTLSKIILSTFLFGIINTAFAENSNYYTIYTNRIGTGICLKYKPGNENEKEKTQSLLKKESVYINPDSKTQTGTEQASSLTGINDSEKYITIAKQVYRNQMNSMYKCALLKIQIVELGNIQKLIKTDKTGELGKSISQQIEQKISKLEAKSKITTTYYDSGLNKITENTGSASHSLVNEDKEWSVCNIKKEKEISKKEVLQNVTYETCKYVSYLDFLRSYYLNTANILNQNSVTKNVESKGNPISETISNLSIDTSNNANKRIEAINGISIKNSIRNKYNKIIFDIDNEEKHTLEIFPIVFQSYNEYAYNYPLHVLLQLIKEDLIIFRDNLHKVLNPINQVVYKISNAMSK